MDLQTLTNLNHILMLVSVIHTDEFLQSRLPNEQNSIALSLPRRNIYEQQLSESQFHCVCDQLRNSQSIRVIWAEGRICIELT
jgi:hypothetical protein